MLLDASFQPVDENGRVHWFVFDDEGRTMVKDMRSKKQAVNWIAYNRSLEWREGGYPQDYGLPHADTKTYQHRKAKGNATH